MRHTQKIFISLFCILSLFVSLSAGAKKKEFSLPGKKFKPQNIVVLKKDWSRELKAGKPSKRYFPETNPPVIDNGVIYVGTNGKIFYAVNSETGKVTWSYKNDEPVSSAAGISPNAVYFSDLGGKIVALHKDTGSLLWTQSFAREMLGKPLVTATHLYTLVGENEIMALDLTDGHVTWREPLPAYIQNLTMRGQADIVIDNKALYVGLANGHLLKINATDGHLLWDKDLTIPLRVFKDIDTHVVIEGDSLYVGGYFGAIYRIQKATGATVWSSDIATGTPPLVLTNIVIVSDINGSVVGLSKTTGQQLWFNTLEGGVLSAPVAYEDKVFVSAFEKGGYLLHAESGSQIQKINFGTGSINEPAVTDQRIFLMTNSAALIALRKK